MSKLSESPIKRKKKIHLKERFLAVNGQSCIPNFHRENKQLNMLPSYELLILANGV